MLLSDTSFPLPSATEPPAYVFDALKESIRFLRDRIPMFPFDSYASRVFAVIVERVVCSIPPLAMRVTPPVPEVISLPRYSFALTDSRWMLPF